MNVYFHFRKKNANNEPPPSEKFKPVVKKTAKFKTAKNAYDIHQLAIEHALAYFHKPWDYYLKEAAAQERRNDGYMLHKNSSSPRGCLNKEGNTNCHSLYDRGQTYQKYQRSCYNETSTQYVSGLNQSYYKKVNRENELISVYRNCSRREPRYEYTALADESILHDRLEMDRKMQKDSDRNMSTIRCQYYLRGCNRYVFLRHLADMGSRLDKNWFVVRDTTTKTERLLTMTPMAEICPMRYHSETRQVLLELFLALQHPYIYPVLDIDRKIVMEQEYIIAVLPFNDEGTLKDVIYQSQCQDDWKDKYHYQGYGLSSAQIQRLGCQVLEGLLFLKDQRFPPFLHLHSGNIIVQNGVARISGLENTLFGYTSRTHLFIPKRLYDNKEAVEVLCFGHLLFEMASGYELTSSHPSEKNYMDVEDKPLVIDVLKYIFEQGRYRFPSLQQVASLDFFRHIDLRELRSLMPAASIKAKLSPAARSLLKEVKRHQRSRRQDKRSQSMYAVETESMDGRESRSSGNSSRSSRKKKKRAHTSNDTTPEDMCEGTLLQTMPLPRIEGSLPTASSRSDSLDYYTPPTTPQTMPKPQMNEEARTRALLLQEIQKGFKLKHSNWFQDPQV